MAETVGFIGLGHMGEPMAWNLHRAGFSLGVYNRTPERAAPFRDSGIPAYATPAELAAASSAVLIMVTDSPALQAVVEAEGGLLEGLDDGTLVINMSTVSHEATCAAARAVEASGGQFVDAPVSGTRKPAEDAALTILAGSEAEALERARPLLDALGRATVHCGPVGTGTDTKHAINLLLGTMMQGFSEALAFSQHRGLNLDTVIEAIQTGATSSPLYQLKGAAIRADDYRKQFPVELLLKDLDLILDAGRQAGVYLPAAATVREAASGANAAGYGEQDMAALLKWLETASGRRSDQS